MVGLLVLEDIFPPLISVLILMIFTKLKKTVTQLKKDIILPDKSKKKNPSGQQF